MSVSYRSLKPDDYDPIIAIWQQAALDHRPQGRDDRENLSAEMRRSPEFCIGAEVDGQLVGTVIGSCDGRKGCVNRVAVAPDFRGRGIAQELIALCESALKKAGAKVLFCLIEDDNEASKKLFEKSGYSCGDGILYYSKRDRPDI